MLNKEEVFKLREEYLLPCMGLFYKDHVYFVRGEMQYVYDENNKKYLDMLGGFSVMASGHSNPYINDRVKKQLDTIVHSTQVFLNEPIVKLAKNLSDILPEELSKSFFVNSGSEANEMAIMVARNYTKKTGIIYLENSLHGRTNNTLAVTGMKMWHPYENFGVQSYQAKSFYPSDNKSFKEQMEISLQSVEDIIKNNEDISCMIVEIIQGNGGVLMPHKDYFKRLKELLNKKGILLITDEAQTGYGRTGRRFAFEHFNFVPDILMTAKALGNGIGIGSITTTKEIGNKFIIPSASTNGGNMLACASALAVIDHMEEFKTYDLANDLGEYLLLELKKLVDSSYKLIDVRGKGLMLGLEIIDFETANEISEDLLKVGIICGRCGVNRNVLLLQPALIVEREDLVMFIESLRKII